MERTNSGSVSVEQLKRYLYAELDDADRDEVDAKLFAEDALFHEAVSVEDDMVDLYATGKLSGEELSRFEQSLEKVPGRRAKVANAVALLAYIDEETRSEIKEAPVGVALDRRTIWQRFLDLFTIRSSLLGPAMASLLVLLTIAGIFLVAENRRKDQELAELQSEKQGLENAWQSQITNTSQSLSELKTELGNSAAERGELVSALSSEQQRVQELEKELETLRDKDSVKPPGGGSGPSITAIALRPTGPGNQLSTARVGENTKRLALNLSLPSGVRDDEALSIHLNEKVFARNVLPSTAPDGSKTVSVTIPAQEVRPGPNKLVVMSPAGKAITEYVFNVDKP
jgi:hypothetical protein